MGGADQLTEIRTYDRANRLKTVAKGSGPASFTYDAAGNPIHESYRGGGSVTQVFDALNRRVMRIVPAVSYSRTFCSEHEIGLLNDGSGCSMVFPEYPNFGSGYRVGADTLRFVYDSGGNLARADSRDAKIWRTYYPNGALATDSTALRDVIGFQTGFSNKYGISFSYDRNGRRTALGSGSDVLLYTYHAGSGALAQIDNKGNRFRFMYDSAGHLDTLLGLSPTGYEAVREWRRYDIDGQLRIRERTSPQMGWLTRDELDYDARGKVVDARTRSASRDHIHKRTTVAYAGLGPVIASEVTDEQLYARWELEEFRTDAFGNVYYSKRTTGADGAAAPRRSEFSLNGAMTAKDALVTPDSSTWMDRLYQRLDAAGNVRTAGGNTETRLSLTTSRQQQSASKSFYSADNRLMAMQRYDATWTSSYSPTPIEHNGTWEEYRYDALGRRVATLVKRDKLTLCKPGAPPKCDSYVERVTWDGDDILYERREFGSQYTNGTVGYVHGGVIDQPLALMDGRILNPNWRGLYESAVNPDGTRVDCTLPGTTPCINVDWPAGSPGFWSSVELTAP